MAFAHHPSALRNRVAIAEELLSLLGPSKPARALEVASGTGAHIEHLAALFPTTTFQPSELCPPDWGARGPAHFGAIGDAGANRLEALDACLAQFGNVRPAIPIDAATPFAEWGVERGGYGLVFASNVCHISPWAVTQGLLAGAAAALAPGGVLAVYGPFKVGGDFTTESNREFDASLRSRNAAWGYRDVAEVVAAAGPELTLTHRRDMPANNHLLVFRREA